MTPDTNRYGGVARFFHWAIAAMIVLQYVLAELGEWAGDNGERLRQLALIANHKSVGITILALAVLRIGWRLANPPPALPTAMKRWQRISSHISHWSLYGFLFALPVTGWLMSSAAAYSVSWFGLFTLPDLIEPSKAWRETLKDVHELLGKALFVIALIHIAAAFKHQWIDKDGVLARITSWASITLFVAVIVVGAATLTRTGSKAVTPAAVTAPEDSVTPATDSDDDTDSSPATDGATADSARTTQRDDATARGADSKPATRASDGSQPAADPARAQPPVAGAETATKDTGDTRANVSREPETATAAAPLSAPVWTIDYANSHIRFTAEQAGARFTGEWQQWRADMRFAADALSDSEFVVTIEVRGVDTRDDERDTTLMDPEWFAADAHPTVVFRTGTFRATADGFESDATLAVKGQRKPVTFRFSVDGDGDSRQLIGSARLDRLALGIGTGEWTDTEWIGQYVDVDVRVDATLR